MAWLVIKVINVNYSLYQLQPTGQKLAAAVIFIDCIYHIFYPVTINCLISIDTSGVVRSYAVPVGNGIVLS